MRQARVMSWKSMAGISKSATTHGFLWEGEYNKTKGVWEFWATNKNTDRRVSPKFADRAKLIMWMSKNSKCVK